MTSQEWTAAVVSPPGDGDAPGIIETDGPTKSRLCVGSCEVVKKMLDFSLLLSPTFIIFAISGMFSMLGMFVPFVFLMNQAEAVLSKELPKGEVVEQSSLTMLISIIGAANTVGRILSGWVADRPFVNALILNNCAVTLMGLSTLTVPLLAKYFHFIMYSCTFGISMGKLNNEMRLK